MSIKSNQWGGQLDYFLQRCQEIVDILADVHRAKTVTISQANNGGLLVRAGSRNKENTFRTGQFFEYSENICCFKVMRSGLPLLVRNNETEFLSSISYLGYPLRHLDKSIYGTIAMLDATPSNTIKMVRSSVEKFRLILEREIAQLYHSNQSN